jgi:hypothetical protein
MAFQPMPLSRRSLQKQIALVLENPLGMVSGLWKKKDGLGTQPPTMETYTEAVNKFTKSATAFMEQVRLFVEARRAYQLWQKELELVRLHKEIEALKLVIPLLIEERVACQIEYGSSGKADAMPCGKPAVARCSDCGTSICEECRVECCGDSFCGQCYDYHVANSCARKPVQAERRPPFPSGGSWFYTRPS